MVMTHVSHFLRRQEGKIKNIDIIHNPVMRRAKKGHPAITRIRTEMDVEERTVRKCGIGRMTDHSRKNYINTDHQ